MAKGHVLVADDDAVIQKIVSANLKARDFMVTTVDDGAAALEAFTDTSPDLVILDIMMPLMDGSEVCRRIRESSGVPIIMISAKSEVASKTELLSLGADDYVVKPFGIDELMARVNAVTRRGVT
jgi:DNA-binding response OmpR family regulator